MKKKSKVVKGWALIYKDEIGLDFALGNFSVYPKKTLAIKTRSAQKSVRTNLFSKDIKVKRVSIIIED